MGKILNILGTRTFFWIILIFTMALVQNSQKRVWEGWTNEAVRNYMIFELIIVVLFFICSGLRSQRIGKSGWLWVTMIIPIVNIYFIFVFGLKKSIIKFK